MRTTLGCVFFYWISSALCMVQAEEQRPTFTEYVPGLFMYLGVHEEVSSENHADIANTGFIVGKKSVAVIDPGGSPAAGVSLRAAIDSVTDLPVSHVILTHVHPDHIFGSSAFADVPSVVAHEKFARALIQRGQFYRDRFHYLFTDSDTPASLSPTVAVPAGSTLTIDLGERPVEINAYATAHTDNDITVFDLISKTLWASDLVFVERIPSLDGSLIGWLEVLDELSQKESGLVIPGHGEPGTWSDVSLPQRRYLESLLTETRVELARRTRLVDAVELIGWSEQAEWELFELRHRGNVTKAFTELEWE